MRVVAGTARGRRLDAPSGQSTRPTSDRVKESIFNILDAMGTLEGARVFDLFAGSGALGIEALSRGASAVTFVEVDVSAVETIKGNLISLGWGSALSSLSTDLRSGVLSCKVVKGDASCWSAGLGDADLVLADPPYAFDAWGSLLRSWLEAGFSGTAVLEGGGPIDLGPAWDVVRTRRYGSTVVQFAKPAVVAGPPVDPKGGR